MEGSADVIKEHISSLISRLLAACMNRKQNPPKIRASALRCLRIFPGAIRNELLLPFKRQVLRSLILVLDDPKRNVRKEVLGFLLSDVLCHCETNLSTTHRPWIVELSGLLWMNQKRKYWRVDTYCYRNGTRGRLVDFIKYKAIFVLHS